MSTQEQIKELMRIATQYELALLNDLYEGHDAEYYQSALEAHACKMMAGVEQASRDAQQLDYLDKYAVIAKPGQSVRDAIDAAMTQPNQPKKDNKP